MSYTVISTQALKETDYLIRSEVNMKKFWMVCSSTSSTSNKKHETKQDAINEAERLAKDNPGKAFHILESIGYWFTPSPVEFSTEYDLTSP